MNYKFQISVLAKQDLESIFEYTLEKWSLVQAEEYFILLQSGIDSICDKPEIGKAINEIKMNHRCLIVKSHYIIYKVIDHSIFIDRILHQRMNIVDILNE